MNAKDAILKIRALFEDMPVEEPKAEPIEEPKAKVEMAEYVLEDGTKVMISELAVGGQVTLEDGSKAPDAEHKLADGMSIVTVDGVITEIKEAEEKCIPLCSNCHRILHWDLTRKAMSKRRKKGGN